MKLFLLIAGHYYYPSAFTDDWIGCFKTYEEAQSKVLKIDKHKCHHPYDKYQIDGSDHLYDWFDIVNLEDWIEE